MASQTTDSITTSTQRDIENAIFPKQTAHKSISAGECRIYSTTREIHTAIPKLNAFLEEYTRKLSGDGNALRGGLPSVEESAAAAPSPTLDN